MQRKFYRDLYNLEEKHWWHKNKRTVIINLIKKFTQNNRKSRLLDVGCGTGKTLEEISNLGIAYGVDISKEAIKFCRKRGLKNARPGSSYKTGFKNSYFDICTLLDVLEHTDDEKTLYEMKRILKKDGLLIITVPAYKFLWSKWDVVLMHKRRYRRSNLKKVLQNNGFKVLKVSYIYSFLILPALIIRLFKSRRYEEDYPSDFHLSNPLLNIFFLTLIKLEYIFSFIIPIPFGTSLVCVCKKK